jgi:hypothetical protein
MPSRNPRSTRRKSGTRSNDVGDGLFGVLVDDLGELGVESVVDRRFSQVGVRRSRKTMATTPLRPRSRPLTPSLPRRSNVSATRKRPLFGVLVDDLGELGVESVVDRRFSQVGVRRRRHLESEDVESDVKPDTKPADQSDDAKPEPKVDEEEESSWARARGGSRFG